MSIYADYTFYEKEYGGSSLNIVDFATASVNASQYIRHITLGRADNYTGTEVKNAMCAVADVYHSVFGKTVNPEKKSETIDGYSVSYSVQKKDGETKEELFKRRAYEVAAYWLSGTGLLSRKVRRKYAY